MTLIYPTYPKKIIGAVSFMLFAAPMYCSVNNTPVVERDYDETVLRFHNSGSLNPAMLTSFNSGNLSRINVSSGFGNGKLRNYYQSDNRFGMGISVESLYRVNENLMLTGVVSYSMDKGKNMAGSAFINPDFRPFDIVEVDTENAGMKRKEMYLLGGNIGYRLSDRFSVGAGLKYLTGNYAKFKDLRHQNTLMNMEVFTGLSYSFSDALTIGASYIYERDIETLYFKIYGNTDKQYTSFINFGGFYGRTELFGESGYTSDSKPLFTEKHGLAFQATLDLEDKRWFNEVYYKRLSGRYGSGASTSVTYSTHEGFDAGYKSKLIIDNKNISHVVGMELSLSSIDNNENSFKESTDENGVSQIVYYGSNKVGDKRWFRANAFYKLLSGGGHERRSRMSFDVLANYNIRTTTTSLYPFYRKHDVKYADIMIAVSRNWIKENNIVSLSLGTGFSSGWGNRNIDGTYVPVDETNKKPYSSDALLQQEFDYLTSSKPFGSVSLGYERELHNILSLYVKADISYYRALNTSLKGLEFTDFCCRMGVKF